MTGAVSLGLSSAAIVITEKPTIKTKRVTEAFVWGSIQTPNHISGGVFLCCFPAAVSQISIRWLGCSPSPCPAGERPGAKGRGHLPLLVHRRHRGCWVQTGKYYCSGFLMLVKSPALWPPGNLPRDSQHSHMLRHWGAADSRPLLRAIGSKCWTDVKFVAFSPCPGSFLPLSTKAVISCSAAVVLHAVHASSCDGPHHVHPPTVGIGWHQFLLISHSCTLRLAKS